MNEDKAIHRVLARYPIVAVAAYAGVLVGLACATWVALADVSDRRADVAGAAELLARLDGRSPAHTGDVEAPSGPVPAGSPFLEGESVTIAGAALLQRVAFSITKFGGNVLSSQVELEGDQAKNGFVSMVATCEIEQPALQHLLYDLEAGMPYLFVEQVVAQGPTPTASRGGERMRVLLGVSGLWPGAGGK